MSYLKLTRVFLNSFNSIACNNLVKQKHSFKFARNYCSEHNSSPNGIHKIQFDFSDGFFKFNLRNNVCVVSYWTPLRSLLCLIDDDSSQFTNNKTIVDEQNKVAFSPKTPIGFVFTSLNSFSFQHSTLGQCQAEFFGSTDQLIKWKQQFEADIHYGHLGKDKPQTAQEQEISFLQHEKQSLKSALNPLLREYKQIVSLARTDAHRKFKWGGLFLLSAQLGFVARLTWFEYSWDIMEPITWMLTYAMMVGTFAYYIVTSQEYLIPSVERRLTISKFWKLAKMYNFDVTKFHQLKNQVKIIDEKILKMKESF